MSNPSDQDARADMCAPQPAAKALGIIGGLFFVFGFVSWANAILIPYFRIACELTHFQAYLVTFAFYISYLLFSLPAALLLRRTGFRRGMMIGFWIMAAGALIFIPAALTRTYAVFLAGLFTLGAGLAILQTAANPYVTLLGPRDTAARRISLMGICNKGAGILAPLLFAAVVLRATDTDLFASLGMMTEAEKAAALDELIRRVIMPYACVGATLLILGLLIRISTLPEIDANRETEETARTQTGKTSILQFPHLILGAIGIFLHVGTQVIAVDTVIGYATSMGLPLTEAKDFPAYTLGTMILGYLTGIALIPRFCSQVTMLRFCTVLGVVLTALIVSVRGETIFLGHRTDLSLWCVVLLGYSNSLTWAGIWPLALEGLGRFTKLGASVMIMGLCGNALLPLAYGWLADRTDVRAAYWVLAPCYLYLVFYATIGHRLRRWSLRG